MEAVVVITVTALDKNTSVTEALCVYLPSHIVQVHSWLTETRQQTVRTFKPQCSRNKIYTKTPLLLRGTVRRTFADVSAGVLDCRVAVDVGQQPEAEAVLVVRRVSEAIYQHTG